MKRNELLINTTAHVSKQKKLNTWVYLIWFNLNGILEEMKLIPRDRVGQWLPEAGGNRRGRQCRSRWRPCCLEGGWCRWCLDVQAELYNGAGALTTGKPAHAVLEQQPRTTGTAPPPRLDVYDVSICFFSSMSGGQLFFKWMAEWGDNTKRNRHMEWRSWTEAYEISWLQEGTDDLKSND